MLKGRKMEPLLVKVFKNSLIDERVELAFSFSWFPVIILIFSLIGCVD